MIKKTLKRIINRITTTPQERRHSMVGLGHLWKMKQTFQFEFLKNHRLQENHKLLDIGCGTLRGGIPLIKFLDNNNYYGIDVRPKVFEEGKKELKIHKLEGKNPSLIAFDQFQNLKFETKFDFMFAFSVLIHLDDTITKSCFKFVSEFLKPEGVFYANVNIENHIDGEWQGFPVVFRNLEFYETIANENGLNLKNIGLLKDLGHISGQHLADKQVMLEIKKFRTKNKRH